MNPNPPQPTPEDEELRKRVANLVEYWDFSPLQDEDSRIKRIESEILEIIKSHADQDKAAALERIKGEVYIDSNSDGSIKTPVVELSVVERELATLQDGGSTV